MHRDMSSSLRTITTGPESIRDCPRADEQKPMAPLCRRTQHRSLAAERAAEGSQTAADTFVQKDFQAGSQQQRYEYPKRITSALALGSSGGSIKKHRI